MAVLAGGWDDIQSTIVGWLSSDEEDEINSEWIDPPKYLSYEAYNQVTHSDYASALYDAFGDVLVVTDTADSFAWAVGAGLLSSTDSTATVLTRDTLATSLYQLAVLLGPIDSGSGNLTAWRDGDSVSDSAQAAWEWALSTGVLSFIEGNELLPQMPVSVSQMYDAIDAMQSDTAAAVTAMAYDSVLQALLEETVEAAASKHNTVALQVAVVHDGQIVASYATGWATLNTTEMTDENKLRIASISKVLIGLAATAMQEDGVIDWDEDISAYWGISVVNPYHTDIPITINTLLTHTSSLVSTDSTSALTYSGAVSMLKGSGYTTGTPGDLSIWSYSNFGFGILGMTLENAVNRRLDDILNDYLFTAMGIDGSFASGSVKDTSLLTTLYYSGGGVGRSISTSLTLLADWDPGTKGVYFAGGYTVSAYELAKVATLLAGDGVYQGVRLLAESSVAAMEEHEDTLVDGELFYQCHPLRYQTDIYGRDSLYYHTGSAYGVYNLFSYDPDTGDAVIVLTTGDDGAKDSYGIYSVCGDIATVMYAAMQ